MTEPMMMPVEDDREAVRLVPAQPGAPVDRSDVYADVTIRDHELRPIVPAALRSAEQRRMLAAWAVRYVGHRSVYHATRSPKYAGKTAWYASWGTLRTLGRLVRWAMAEEGNWALRQQAATTNDAAVWLRLDATRERHARWRWSVLGVGLVAALVLALVLVSDLVPWWARWAALAVAVPALARAGRPVDRSILDRVTVGQAFIKLTAEMTRAALVACGAGIKDPDAVKFVHDIGRDGPGFLAQVALPPGVVATDVIDKRDRLAAGLRLPHDQVWPEQVKGEHPGRLNIFVTDRPVSAMRQPAWPLLDVGTVDYFEPFPYGFDVRLRRVAWALAERNSLFGGVPGSGKSLAARNVLLGAVLDPLVIPVVSELKGSGDFDAFEPLCPRGLYVSGPDDEAIRRTLGIVEWLHGLCEERAPLVARYAKAGMNTTRKVNRAMAEHDERLRPVVAVFDEIQEFMASPLGIKGAGVPLLLSTVKRARALSIHVVMATQRFDKESMPKALSSLVTNRGALAVPAQPETDMILGTSAYRSGARPTAFVPGEDSGWMVRAGFAPGYETIRAAYLDDKAAEAVCARAAVLRSGQPVAEPIRVPAHNLLEDVAAVLLPGEDAVWSELLVERLAALRPDVYGSWDVAAFGAAMKAAGLRTVSIHRKVDGRGTTRYGVRRDALADVLSRRQLDR